MSLKSKMQFLLVALIGFSGPALAQADDPVIAALRKAGQVKAAVSSVPPLLTISRDGNATGYMAKITNLALKGLDLPEITPVVTAYGSMIPSLKAGQVDLVVPIMQPNRERCEQVLFSAPVFLNRNVLFVKAGNPKHLTNLSQIAGTPDLKVAVQPGGSNETQALKAGVKRGQLVPTPDNQAGMATVIGGRADAWLGGQASFPASTLKKLGAEIVVDPQLDIVLYGIVVRKENTGFRDALSEQVNILRENGKMKEALQKWAVEADFAENDFALMWDTLSKVRTIGESMPDCR
ncbi:transporter substrate-binding domain-containing protein [Bradyrhizobium diversitatis]|uniref:Transporter substrate-binding domain-containing protein n=1 Tax=Bradyrhizobium diversitatis TaxID=2755406 RepID=A0ABS0PBJ6_9BRAD|nr:transporter substrate-binding domain-containing protein [Bradyrhizobium diversitatis]MBH5390676.1 transporter substrate-binding domain-containing protein [Bradyrhizobium diversitatis]